ncbi:DUF3558 domain-containing protein [Solihabitans fulvus]|uniref:DUF3558 domain-containing protein n=1 Tax=Solihabitans fulvus TaxID=1892852 RepID=A0A5B2WME9_9PSEU|nr:DUF3558 domain-containing protein [Solihabitans fulvus]KAA2251217.1 DUF3558 domain-containing protein [Solihabitans fulvus]
MPTCRRGVSTTSALVAAALALTGCGTLTRPAANSVPPAAPTTTTSATPSVTLPPRPRPLPLGSIDPCRILTRDQRTALSLDNSPSDYVDKAFGNAKACTIRGLRTGNVARLALVTAQGIEVWLDENAQTDARPASVGGFPALTVRTPGIANACNVDVDVADGQFLDVLFRDGGNDRPAPQDTLCLGAQRVAEAAMTSLGAKH